MAALLVLVSCAGEHHAAHHAVHRAEKKGAVYALVAVSMNLLNGFTGLFSLGQAGFMLLGAYTYAILTIPPADREASYYPITAARFLIPNSLPKLFGGFGLGWCWVCCWPDPGRAVWRRCSPGSSACRCCG